MAKSKNLLDKIKNQNLKSKIELRIKEEKKYELKMDSIKDELEGGTLFHSDKGERAMEIKNLYKNEYSIESK